MTTVVRGSMFDCIKEGAERRAKQRVDDSFEERYTMFKETVAHRLKNDDSNYNNWGGNNIYIFIKIHLCEDTNYMKERLIERFNEDTKTFGGFSINIIVCECGIYGEYRIHISW